MSEFAHLLPRHDGHHEKAEGYYKANNNIVKYGFWLLTLLVLFACLVARVTASLIRRYGRPSDYTRIESDSDKHDASQMDNYRSAKSPSTRMPQVSWEEMRTKFRLITYKRTVFSHRWLRYWTPPSRGELLFLCLYWAVVLAGLWTNVIFESPSELYGIQWEVVGFRAAWVSTTQLPLLYATGCRINVISLATGITHERLNWFHRWIARTVFMTLIVHWAFFYREWDIAGFVKQEFAAMPMIIWGFAAWGAIGLMVLSGFGWFRTWNFEVWLISHITLAWAVLALSYTHTHCTTYFVAASVAILLFDLIARAVLVLLHNIDYRRGLGRGLSKFGHQAKLERLNPSYCRLTINSPKFRWQAGQHVYLIAPEIGGFQSHPFTIIGSDTAVDRSLDYSLSLIIKAHTGFTKKLHAAASASSSSSSSTHKNVLLQGPYGNPPTLHSKDVAIFIATGNRVSFTISLLGAVITDRVRRGIDSIFFHWIVPDAEMILWYEEELQRCAAICLSSGINLEVCIYITRVTPPPLPTSDLAKEAVFEIGRDSIDSEDDNSKLLFDNEKGDVIIERSRTSALTLHKSRSQFPNTIAVEATSDSDILAIEQQVAPTGEKILEQDNADADEDDETADDAEFALIHNETNPLQQQDRILSTSISQQLHNDDDSDDNDDSDDVLRNKVEANIPLPTTTFSRSYSRPSADELIRPTVIDRDNDHSPWKIMVVAAVAPTFAVDVTRTVNRLLRGDRPEQDPSIPFQSELVSSLSSSSSTPRRKTRDIELWIEDNGGS